MSTKTKHGLTDGHIQIIRNILGPYAAHITQVDLFGSRATGTYSDNSDIDLVLHGELDRKILDRLWTLFQESSLPYKVDIVLYETIGYLPLKEHIDKVRLLLLQQSDLLQKDERQIWSISCTDLPRKTTAINSNYRK